MRRVVQIEAPWREPAAALSALAEEAWSLCLLSGGGGVRGRWTYLAARPLRTLIVQASDPTDPFAALAALIPAGEMLTDGPPFQGGVAGLAAYELGGRAQGLDLAPHPDWPHLACAVYPAILAFDHRDRRLLAIGRGEDAAQAQARAQGLLDALGQRAADDTIGDLGRIDTSSFDHRADRMGSQRRRGCVVEGTTISSPDWRACGSHNDSITH